MRFAVLRFLVMAVALLAAGCTAVVTAPAPDEPRAAFILEHGRHTSLVLTNQEGMPVRYAFGELRWYAHSQTGFFRGLSALLTPTPGTLGRRELAEPATRENIRTAVGVPIEFVHCLAAPADRVDRLGRLLDEVFNQHVDTLHVNERMNLEFVEVPERYWFGTNSNNAVGRWLERLDAEVTGSTAFANWRVIYPDDETPEVCRDEVIGEGWL